MRDKTTSKIPNSPQSPTLRHIMQDYHPHTDRTYRLVVDGCSMRLAPHHTHDWFQIYSNMEVNPKHTMPLFTTILSDAGFLKRRNKAGTGSKALVKEPKQKRFRMESRRQNGEEKEGRVQKENRESNCELPL